MRTLLNEIAVIEKQLSGQVSPQEALLFEAQAIINPILRQNITAQKETYRLIELYSRKQLKAELNNIHQKLFTETKHRVFANAIKNLFGKV